MLGYKGQFFKSGFFPHALSLILVGDPAIFRNTDVIISPKDKFEKNLCVEHFCENELKVQMMHK